MLLMKAILLAVTRSMYWPQEERDGAMEVVWSVQLPPWYPDSMWHYIIYISYYLNSGSDLTINLYYIFRNYFSELKDHIDNVLNAVFKF